MKKVKHNQGAGSSGPSHNHRQGSDTGAGFGADWSPDAHSSNGHGRARGNGVRRNDAPAHHIWEGAPAYRRRPLISVFGSARPHRDDELYAAGVHMGELLGAAGCDVMTGGYTGVMEAVSRGAHRAGAHVIGVTMRRFQDRVNRYVMDEIHTASFYERFGWLVDRADGYIAMHGGNGTLAEVTFTWQEILLGMMPKRPLILCGRPWRAIRDELAKSLVPAPHLFDPLTLVDTPDEAVEIIRAHFGLGQLHPRGDC
ncbi:MAG: LOG family protein [Candidatus Binataceae bacterium]